jgi:protein-tyrosine kinase
MEHIRAAIERAKGAAGAAGQPQEQFASDVRQQQFLPNSVPSTVMWGQEITIAGPQLEPKRVVAHDITDPRSRSFDMLRTQVLQSMDSKNSQLIGLTSPTPGCGKSLIAVNLALSICRQQERSVLLIDLDLRRPQVASYLGLNSKDGLLSVLEGRSKLASAIVQVNVRNHQFLALPCEAPTLSSSEWMASRAMTALLQDIRQSFRNWTVIVDLPPILPSDDVITILPQIDSTILVAAIGMTTMSEIKECTKHLESAAVARVVLNKAPNPPSEYYAYMTHSDSATKKKRRWGLKRRDSKRH